jgi:hypothetical protein
MKLLDLLNVYDTMFDVILLSEIWCTNLNYFDNIFADYKFISCPPTSQRAGGVAILIHNSVSYQIVDSSNDNNFFDTSAEFIVFDVLQDSDKYRFYLFYRHPSQSMLKFIDMFFNYIAICKPSKKSLIIGDLNIDLMKFDSNSYVERYITDLDTLNFTPFSILPTHCVNNSHSVIDHVFTNFGFDYSNGSTPGINSLTVTCDISDHYANIVLLVSRKSRVNYCDRPLIRIYSHKNIENFKNQLSIVDWNPVYNSDRVISRISWTGGFKKRGGTQYF